MTMNTFAEIRLGAFFDELEKIGNARSRLAGTVANSLSGGLTGAGVGAATGALAAKPGERGKGAAQGALVGGTTGLVGGGIIGGASNIGTKVKQVMQANRSALRGPKGAAAAEKLLERAAKVSKGQEAGVRVGNAIGAGGALVAAPVVSYKATRKNKEE